MIKPKELVDEYAGWVEERVAMGFRPTLLTFMFNPIPGSQATIQREMYATVGRTFNKVLTRTLRRPRGAPWFQLPLWIGCTDFPVMKWNRDHFANIAINDGQHVHAIALDPPTSRLVRSGKTLSQHIWDDNQDLYFRPEPKLHRIHCLEIEDEAGYVADYTLKALKSGRTSVDDVLVLPRAMSEL